MSHSSHIVARVEDISYAAIASYNKNHNINSS